VNQFLYRLIPPRPTFAADMSDDEAAVMGEHAAYWEALLEQGVLVAFGPVADPEGSWGLAVVEADTDEDVRRLAAEDPAVRSGLATFDVFAMPGAIVRARAT
jgi:uncharacterized protein